MEPARPVAEDRTREPSRGVPVSSLAPEARLAAGRLLREAASLRARLRLRDSRADTRALTMVLAALDRLGVAR